MKTISIKILSPVIFLTFLILSFSAFAQKEREFITVWDLSKKGSENTQLVL